MKSKKWTDNEENLLLEELSEGLNIKAIALLHSRTIGGINSRKNVLVYRMYQNHYNIDEISECIKLNKNYVKHLIHKKNNISHHDEVDQLRKDIIKLKIFINDLKINNWKIKYS